MKGAQSFQGQFKTLSHDAIEVHLVTEDRTFPRANVFRVSAKGPSHRGRNALIGALVGAGVGLGAGAATDRPGSWFPNTGKQILTPVGAVIGTVAGAALTRGGWVELYRSDEGLDR